MECPHCGGPLDSRQLKPIAHAAFDDRLRQIVIGDKRRRVAGQQWRMLRIMRERFGHFVPSEYLAQWSAFDPSEGGSIEVLKVQIANLRKQIAGTPFAIATSYAHGYGLFWADQVKIAVDRLGHRYIRAPDETPDRTRLQWENQPGTAL